jgi:hypothetical protein
MNETEYSALLATLGEQYEHAKSEWVKTNNAKKEAEEAHQESINTMREIENLMLTTMLEAGVEKNTFKDLIFKTVEKSYNVVDNKAAIEAIKIRGLADQFIKPTITGLKKHKLSEFITQETTIGLSVESTMKE